MWSLEQSLAVEPDNFDSKYLFTYTQSVTEAVNLLNRGFPWAYKYAIVFSKTKAHHFLLCRDKSCKRYVVGKKLPSWAKPWRVDYSTNAIAFAKVNRKYFFGAYPSSDIAVAGLNYHQTNWPYEYAVIYATDVQQYILLCKRRPCGDRQAGSELEVYHPDDIPVYDQVGQE